MRRVIEKNKRRSRRKTHIRKSIFGTAERPRMTVYRSNKKIYVQVIDDNQGKTLASVSNLEAEYRNLKNCVDTAAKLGTVIGERLKEKSIESVVYDRNGFKYHGIVKAIADGARKAGITF